MKYSNVELSQRIDQGFYQAATLFSRAVGALGMLVASMVLFGWSQQLEFLKGFGGAVTMKPNAALCIFLAAASLYALNQRGSRFARYSGIVYAAMAAIVGAATLSEHIAGWDLGIDQLLFREAPGALATASPGRMGPPAASCFAMAGIALILYHAGRGYVLAQSFSVAICISSLLALFGYAYDVEQFYLIAQYTGIALHTAVTLFLLGLGLLAARANQGFVLLVSSNSAGGLLVRRLLPFAIIAPFVLGWVRIAGQKAGFYGLGFGVSILVISIMVIFSLVIWRSAVKVNAIEEQRLITAAALRERQGQLQQALATAKEASRLKDEFLATVSHELRTPLNAILGWAHILQSKAVEPNVTASAVDAIYTSARNQAQLIDDLLDVSRIIGGKMELHPENLRIADVISAALATVSHAVSAKRIVVECLYSAEVEKLWLYADRRRLQQAFWNLLSNAVKFTPAGGKIEIKVERSPSELIVVFQDTGIGIHSDFLPLIFERFRQADSSTTRKFGGLGLGLSITKNLVELHGGTIVAESEGEGSGSRFTVRLPLSSNQPQVAIFHQPVPELVSAEVAAYDIKLPDLRILLVDDDEETLQLVCRAFEPSGAQVRTSRFAEEALETFKAWNPELLISDIAMPGFDGYWLIQQVRDLPDDMGSIPAIALTAYASAEHQARILSAGFQMFVSKPVEPSALLRAAENLTNRKESPEAPAISSVEAARGPALAGKKILLIDDDLLSAEMFRVAMEKSGLEFRSAARASDALQLLQQWLPDVIISDLGLPDEDGCRLIHKIRNLPGGAQAAIPAIALTGYGKDEGDRAVAAGFQVYKDKTIEPDALIAVINDLMK